MLSFVVIVSRNLTGLHTTIQTSTIPTVAVPTMGYLLAKGTAV